MTRAKISASKNSAAKTATMAYVSTNTAAPLS
jgi:hypothetical protein